MGTILSPEKERVLRVSQKLFLNFRLIFFKYATYLYIILRNRSDNFTILANPNTFTTILVGGAGEGVFPHNCIIELTQIWYDCL